MLNLSACFFNKNGKNSEIMSSFLAKIYQFYQLNLDIVLLHLILNSLKQFYFLDV